MSSKTISEDRPGSLLKADLESSRVAESYLFTGPPGSGKLAAALGFAKALNCRRSDPAEPDEPSLGLAETAVAMDQRIISEACGSCSSCGKIDRGNHPDVFVLDFESQGVLLDLKEDERSRQKEFRIEAVRKLIARCYITPLEGRKKVMIINGAELLSEESANALLKILEECPPHAVWILLAVGTERIIPTIQSRVRKVSFKADDHRGAETASQLETLADDFFLRRGQLNPLELSAQVMAAAKKGSQKKQAEEFLKAVTRKLSEELHGNPCPAAAERLALVLQSQEELRRNVSPQLVLDSILLALF